MPRPQHPGFSLAVVGRHRPVVRTRAPREYPPCRHTHSSPYRPLRTHINMIVRHTSALPVSSGANVSGYPHHIRRYVNPIRRPRMDCGAGFETSSLTCNDGDGYIRRARTTFFLSLEWLAPCPFSFKFSRTQDVLVSPQPQQRETGGRLNAPRLRTLAAHQVTVDRRQRASRCAVRVRVAVSGVRFAPGSSRRAPLLLHL
ncbi:hypothetical protein LXA43DRAFT_136276 [Ganoderma leucocontextum]|nr:hypothetical protein LXA43DRAFT_136276 [Ganoderma leucocontextum]